MRGAHGGGARAAALLVAVALSTPAAAALCHARTRAVVNEHCPFAFGDACQQCVRQHGGAGAAGACTDAAAAAVCLRGAPATLTVLAASRLSEARRNIGAVALAAPGLAVFAGGCTLQGRGVQFVCDKASAAIDQLDGNGTLLHTAQLSEARGWVSTCAVPGGSVVMAGGGTQGTRPHSRVADVLDTSTQTVTSTADALSAGRWGISCATIRDTVFFVGGKVVPSFGHAYTVDSIDAYSQQDRAFKLTPLKLSDPRESSAALNVNGSLVVSGMQHVYPRGCSAPMLARQRLEATGTRRSVSRFARATPALGSGHVPVVCGSESGGRCFALLTTRVRACAVATVAARPAAERRLESHAAEPVRR